MKRKTKLAVLGLATFSMLAFTTGSQNEAENLPLGSYSISLNVKDLSVSQAFYKRLGFKPIDGIGSIDQKWMILTNGDTKIGLFEGLFPKNTITFNPDDGRIIYQALKKQGIESTFQIGMDKKEGPCSFSITDPDGNPILIDQH